MLMHAFVPLLALVYSVRAFSNTVYVIAGAEPPSLGRFGLSLVGQRRATECIPQVFAPLNIGKIIVCPRNLDSAVCFETVNTVAPLAKSLNLTLDTSCGADENTDDDCVSKLLTKFTKTSTKAILIAWDLGNTGALLDHIDVDIPDSDDSSSDEDGSHLDLIMTIVKNELVNTTSMNCDGIDGVAPGSDVEATSVVRRSRKARRSGKNKKRANKL